MTKLSGTMVEVRFNENDGSLLEFIDNKGPDVQTVKNTIIAYYQELKPRQAERKAKDDRELIWTIRKKCMISFITANAKDDASKKKLKKLVHIIISIVRKGTANAPIESIPHLPDNDTTKSLRLKLTRKNISKSTKRGTRMELQKAWAGIACELCEDLLVNNKETEHFIGILRVINQSRTQYQMKQNEKVARYNEGIIVARVEDRKEMQKYWDAAVIEVKARRAMTGTNYYTNTTSKALFEQFKRINKETLDESDTMEEAIAKATKRLNKLLDKSDEDVEFDEEEELDEEGEFEFEFDSEGGGGIETEFESSGVDGVASDEGEEEVAREYRLTMIFTVQELKKTIPIMCCNLAACCRWVSTDGKEIWDTCLDCLTCDFNGWPGIDELPVDHLTEEHCQLIVEKCSNPKVNPYPILPDLPKAPRLLLTADSKKSKGCLDTTDEDSDSVFTLSDTVSDNRKRHVATKSNKKQCSSKRSK